MAELIFKFSEGTECRVELDPVTLALRYLIFLEKGVRNASRRIGVSKNVINLWLKKIKNPNEENLQKICDLIEVEKSIIKNSEKTR